MDQVRTGFIRGTGAAVNVSLGWIPEYVKVVNATDGDVFYAGFPAGGLRVMPFSGGGTTEIRKGDTIKGATSAATAKVVDVILDSGTWAGGTAAGWLLIDGGSKTGTFTSENVYVASDNVSGLDDATVTVDTSPAVDSDTEVGGAANSVAPYYGDDGTPAGFTISSTVSEDGKLLFFVALRSGPGGGGKLVVNSL